VFDSIKAEKDRSELEAMMHAINARIDGMTGENSISPELWRIISDQLRVASQIAAQLVANYRKLHQREQKNA
jgi:hypothetical protein